MSKTSSSMLESPRLQRLERLADTQEIRDALTRYCRGTDRCDFELAASAFYRDSTENHGPFVGTSHDFLAMVMPLLRQYEGLFRYITNLSVEFDGDKAVSESYWVAILRDVTTDTVQAGRYLDRWERREGEWKIAARLAICEWCRTDIRNAFPFPHEAEAIMKFAKRGLEDPEVRAVIGLV
jgi:hypothetical protein